MAGLTRKDSYVNCYAGLSSCCFFQFSSAEQYLIEDIENLSEGFKSVYPYCGKQVDDLVWLLGP